MTYQKARYDHVLAAHRQGSGSEFQMYGGDQGSPPSEPASGNCAVYNANGNVIDGGKPPGETDHGALTGLGDNDHTQYLLRSDNVTDITLIIDGAGSAIATGIKADLFIDFACTINRVTLLADQTGSIVIDIWKDTYVNYPPTVLDSICGAAKPTISAAVKSQDSTLTGWTTSIAAGVSLRFNVDSGATITRVALVLKVTKG